MQGFNDWVAFRHHSFLSRVTLGVVSRNAQRRATALAGRYGPHRLDWKHVFFESDEAPELRIFAAGVLLSACALSSCAVLRSEICCLPSDRELRCFL